MCHRARLKGKENLSRYRAWFEGNLLRFVRALAHVRANDAKIVRSRDARCKAKGPGKRGHNGPIYTIDGSSV